MPYLVSNIVEILDVEPEEEEQDESSLDLNTQVKGKCVVIKTSTRQVKLLFINEMLFILYFSKSSFLLKLYKFVFF